MSNAFDVLKERGFIQQTTHEEPLRELLGKERVTYYVGFDPTADSLHVGSVLPLMAMAHMQQAGHKPIVLLGGGTAMIGDPSGKTEMRQMLTTETITANAERFKAQIGRYLDLGTSRGMMLNNADWLLQLNYISFLREIGSQFSVNRMLTAECFKSRMEHGLSFIEFNYMLLQSYDFLELYRKHGCRLQMGGDDQWSNILYGADLVRRLESAEAYGLTFPLLTTSSGRKMGKTEAGAVWLDKDKTSPFDFYQYWRNTDDADVARFLALYTFLPMAEVRKLGALQGSELNEAKKVLAFEVTRITHGEEAATQTQSAVAAAFGGSGNGAAIPTTTVTRAQAEAGIAILDLLCSTGLASSKGEGRRLIDQGGLSFNGQVVNDAMMIINSEHIQGERSSGFKKGKKVFHRVKIED